MHDPLFWQTLLELTWSREVSLSIQVISDDEFHITIPEDIMSVERERLSDVLDAVFHDSNTCVSFTWTVDYLKVRLQC